MKPQPKSWRAYPPQDPAEFEQLCSIIRVKQPKRILEVGSRHGRSLIRFAEAAMPALEEVVSIDLPGGPWGDEDSASSLVSMLEHLRHRGIRTDYFLEDSHSDDARERAKQWAGKFDFIFLDGDHRYEGITADFEIYWPCLAGRGTMAFHDIAGSEIQNRRNKLTLGVPQFWRELEVPDGALKSNIISEGKGFGIGVLYAGRCLT